MTEDVAAVLAGSKPWAVEQSDALSVLQQMPAESAHTVWLRTSPRSRWRKWGTFSDEVAALNALHRRWVPGEKLIRRDDADPNEDRQ